MQQDAVLAAIMRLGASAQGVFRGADAVAAGATRKQLGRLVAAGVVERVLPDTFRIQAVPRSAAQALRAALLWAGPNAAAAGRSAGEVYELEGVRARWPEITVPRAFGGRSDDVVIHRLGDPASMPRRHRGFRVTSPECTVTMLAHLLDAEALETACEDARRRKLTSVAALERYVDRYGARGRRGVAPLRRLLRELDPVHPSRSVLEVKARRILVAHGLTGFERELPLGWNGRTYRFDFAFVRERVILETNGRRWHDDAADYERDNEKWSVPGRHGFRLVLATWEKVTRRPGGFVAELRAALAARRSGSPSAP